MRKNGCVCPPGVLQSLLLFSLSYQVLTSVILVIPLSDYPVNVRITQIEFALLSLPFQIAVIILGVVLTASDPTDKIVYLHRESISVG